MINKIAAIPHLGLSPVEGPPVGLLPEKQILHAYSLALLKVIAL
jgi:hypothetical protein